MKNRTKERKKPRFLPRVTAILLVCSLGLWLVSMAGATYYLAMTVRNAVINGATNDAQDWVWRASSSAETSGLYDREEDNGMYLYWLYQTCLNPYFQLIRPVSNYVSDEGVWYMSGGEGDWMHVEWESFAGVYDKEGNPILVREPSLLLSCAGEDGTVRSYVYARASERLGDLAYLYSWDSCRVSGWMEDDGHLEMLEMWGKMSPEDAATQVYLREGIPYNYAETGKTLEDYVPEGKELVTIEPEYASQNWYVATSPVTALGMTYNDLGAFLGDRVKSRVENASVEERGLWNDTLFDLIFTYVEKIYLDDLSDAYLTEEEFENREQVLLACSVRCSPLLTAMNWLKGVYLVTLSLTLVWPQAVQSLLKKKVVQPLERVQAAVEDGLRPLPPHPPVEYAFREINAAVNGYDDAAQSRRMLQNENVRLTRAVEYAKKAEEDRRLMTSNLAHELKTPLAVVHSYAEGLQEHIAEDKREQYVDVILSETERMDGVVLDMLALSRLESGKARLERTEFDLCALVRERFDALKLQAEEKRLQVTLALEGEQMVYADEERMGQVVSNYASNAVRYTPEGGSVQVRVYRDRRGTVCEVENTCQPLPEEALTRVWESFYRVSKSRSQRGTGLGLTIAKSIVELHGGWVSVRNTETGVVFSFGLKN